MTHSDSEPVEEEVRWPAVRLRRSPQQAIGGAEIPGRIEVP